MAGLLVPWQESGAWLETVAVPQIGRPGQPQCPCKAGRNPLDIISTVYETALAYGERDGAEQDVVSGRFAVDHHDVIESDIPVLLTTPEIDKA
jgi:hypothetical protein